ncbi:hypothetical protein AK812_SmicGene18776 [Symbiodinium microadriaticum]|uniref:Uncharacterized protein n=1 Tax=Symbiodinium microadriaticum TaxID=2951 RepID=A0A1Q9DU86_SYMMI|nr:hypothetical protein AK812_SmicGene18776 [Symbiodinium microadriaticum]
MTRRVQSLSFPVLTGPSWEESTNASSFRDVQDIPILAFDRQFACSDTKIWEELQVEEDSGAEEVAVQAECSAAEAEKSQPSKFDLLDAELSAEEAFSSLPRQPQSRNA